MSLRKNQNEKNQKKRESDDLDPEIKTMRDQNLRISVRLLIRNRNQKKSQNDQNQKIIKVEEKKTGQVLLDINMHLEHQNLLEEKCMRLNLKNTKQIKIIEEL